VTDPIQDSHHGEVLEAAPAVRSGVKIATNAKGMAQVTVLLYAGETVDEMERLKNLAVETYNKTIALLGARANL
jgi:hypothetical protein